MNFDQLLQRYYEWTPKRVIGEYWASEIYWIKVGKVTVENWSQPPELPLEALQKIAVGEALEWKLRDILLKNNYQFKYQQKKYLKLAPGIKLVVKCDFEFPNLILETKYSNFLGEWARFQMECEYRAWKKEVWYGRLTIPFSCKFIRYEPSDSRWEEVQSVVKDFHEKLTSR
ncbi:hypothetical protein DRN58_04075 [Thermococci archaeon]|nr:MAG: hypothetical protein DRN58_04075 [Thermococci archaeon]